MYHAENRKMQRPEIDLGLAVAECHAEPGCGMPLHVIAAFCGCSKSRIKAIESEALRRLRWSAHGWELQDQD